MTIEWVEIDRLTPNPKNPNKHSEEQIERLTQIIKYQGWRHPIIVDKNFMIWAGHGRLLAAKKLKLEKVPIHVQEFIDEDQAYAFLVSDNAIASWAELDLSAINLQIPEFDPEFDIDLLGIKDFEIEPADKYADQDADAIPEKVDAITKPGDLWILGEHRLLCGNSTKREDVERLMNGEKADMVFTDPPYGMNLDTDFSTILGSLGRKNGTQGNKYSKVIGDNEDFKPELITSIFSSFNCREVFLFGADYYAELLPNKNQGSWLVWDKRKESQADAIGSEFELVWSQQKHKRRMLRHDWFGFLSSENTHDARNRIHPTQKPITLLIDILQQWGKETKLVVDPYLGSGSTLIVCEKTSRRCFGAEIDPHYCGVIITRWEKFTGKKAELSHGR